ncbi:MAG: Flp pilus assembly protein CpaB [Phycisphaerae bacterium]
MRVSLLIPLIGGLAAGVFAAYSLWSASQKGGEPERPVTKIPVVVAESEIPYAAQITEEMLTTVEFVEFNPLQQTAGETKAVVGRVAASKIVKGAPILNNMLAPEGTLPGAMNQIPVGYCPVSVVVPRYTVQYVEPGDRVDVLWANKPQGRSAGPRQMKPLFDKVEVFSIGDKRYGAGMPADDGSGGNTTGSRPLRSAGTSGSGTVSVDLLLSRKKAQLFETAKLNGEIRLMPRGKDDNLPFAAADMDFETLFNLHKDEGEQEPVVEPVRKRIKVIHGGRPESSVMFDQEASEPQGRSAASPRRSPARGAMLRFLAERAKLANQEHKNGD